MKCMKLETATHEQIELLLEGGSEEGRRDREREGEDKRRGKKK